MQAPLTKDMESFGYQTKGVASFLKPESLLENLSIGLVVVDDEGTISLMNQAAERIFQVSRYDILGKRVYMLPLKTPIYRVLSENCRDYPVEMSIYGMVVNVRSTSVICSGGSCLGEMYELRDITSERREQRRSDEFVASMTHDLKSPLTVIMGYVDALAGVGSVGENTKALKFLDEMKRSGKRILGMIEDILDSYRLDMGLVEIRREFCDVGNVLETCCQEMLRDAEKHDINLTWSIDPAIPDTHADARQISRIFANLISNAIKFTPAGGSVSVDAARAGGEIVVTVADSGIGIPPLDQSRIFNKYFRSDRVRGYKGTGLGLTICRALTEGHGGVIEVASSEGEGSRFTVRLPVVPNP
jgi:signal transduction histidine kinase